MRTDFNTVIYVTHGQQPDDNTFMSKRLVSL